MVVGDQYRVCKPRRTPYCSYLGAFVLAEQLPLRSFLGFALIATALAVIDGRLSKLARRTFSTARGSSIPW